MDDMTLTAVSMHPTRDVVLPVPGFKAGGVLRAPGWFSYPGGKALNAARAAGKTGAASRAVVLAPPEWRTRLREFLGRDRVGFTLIPVEGEGRVCAVLRDGTRETVINTDLRMALPAPAKAALAGAIARAARREGVVLLAGSLPPTLTTAAARQLYRIASTGKAKFAADQTGARLREAIRHRPFVIKPNLPEFHALVGRRTRTISEHVAAARGLNVAGVGRVLLSMGAHGCLLVSRAQGWVADPLPAPRGESSPIGCGDALLGTFLGRLTLGDPEPVALAWGVAAATANLAHPGACLYPADEVRPLVKRVRIRRLG